MTLISSGYCIQNLLDRLIFIISLYLKRKMRERENLTEIGNEKPEENDEQFKSVKI